MIPRLPILLPILGAVMAYASAQAVGEMAGVWGVVFVGFGYVGFGLVVAFLVGWPQLWEEGDDRG